MFVPVAVPVAVPRRFFPRMGMHKEWFEACRFTPALVEECLIEQGSVHTAPHQSKLAVDSPHSLSSALRCRPCRTRRCPVRC